MAPTPPPADESLVERVQTFVGENRRVVIGAAIVAAFGVGYYVYSSSRADEGGKKPKEKKDKKTPKKSKAGRRLDQPDGPILEERGSDEDIVDAAKIKALSTDERTKRAAELKARGNSAYTQRKFEEAIEFYNQAIAMSPKPESVFYSNRAASYSNLKPPRYDKVIEDCTAALSVDNKYIKALNRRAAALEAVGRLEEALRDYTALAVLDGFENEGPTKTVERVLIKFSTQEAEKILRSREPRLPSSSFIASYFSAFRARPHVILPDNPTDGDRKLLEAQQALADCQYVRAQQLVYAAFDSGLTESWREGFGEALNLRATFKFLLGDTVGAKDDFLHSTQVTPDLVQSWVKVASVYMELNQPDAAFAAFDTAVAADPECADIYYHRGQVCFILGQFDQAAEDYKRSSELDPTFVFSYIQLAVAQYKLGNLDESMSIFRDAMIAFPGRGEPHNYYGELLLDQQRFQEALDRFDKAIEYERQKKNPNPLPFVNKALVMYQWQQDLPGAAELCREALTIDDECDAAVATLSQLSLQQGKVEEAVEMFGQHVAITRTEPELIQALSYWHAARAQLEFQKNYPDMEGYLRSMGPGMQAPFGAG